VNFDKLNLELSKKLDKTKRIRGITKKIICHIKGAIPIPNAFKGFSFIVLEVPRFLFASLDRLFDHNQ
jgi:hypothetical protein